MMSPLFKVPTLPFDTICIVLGTDGYAFLALAGSARNDVETPLALTQVETK